MLNIFPTLICVSLRTLWGGIGGPCSRSLSPARAMVPGKKKEQEIKWGCSMDPAWPVVCKEQKAMRQPEPQYLYMLITFTLKEMLRALSDDSGLWWSQTKENFLLMRTVGWDGTLTRGLCFPIGKACFYYSFDQGTRMSPADVILPLGITAARTLRPQLWLEAHGIMFPHTIASLHGKILRLG